MAYQEKHNNHCKEIAENLYEVVSWNIIQCPHCGEQTNVMNMYNDYEGSCVCESCGAVIDVDEAEKINLHDYLEDIYDV